MRSPRIKPLFSPWPDTAWAGIQNQSPGKTARIQSRLLRKHVAFTVENSPFYRRLFTENGIDFRKITHASDLESLPFTEKKDLLSGGSAFLASPNAIVDLCLTSGTSGTAPAILSQTAGDLARLAYNESEAFSMAGLAPADTLLVCAAMDRGFMAGLAYFLGGVRLGARVVRGGSGSAAQNWHLIMSTGATALVGVPSLFRKIAEYGLSTGASPADSSVRRLIAIGEPVRDSSLALLPLAHTLEETWQASLYSTYASTEMATAFCECEARQGGHLRPELCIVEIVDEAGRTLREGQTGEVVVTPLGVTGMPLIRFKTGDISFLIGEPCPCGRRTGRIGPILGRRNQMLKFKGTSLFPNTILSVLAGKPYFHGGCVEARKFQDGTDHVILFLSSEGGEARRREIEDLLRAALRVVPEMVFVSKEEMEKKTQATGEKRKAVTFIDLREEKAGRAGSA